MAYTPKEWENGDIITAEDLNKMEQGISEASEGSEAFVITFTNNSSDPYNPTFVTDKTFDEAVDAYNSGKTIRAKITGLPTRVQDIALQSVNYDNGVVDRMFFTYANVSSSGMSVQEMAFNREGSSDWYSTYFNANA